MVSFFAGMLCLSRLQHCMRIHAGTDIEGSDKLTNPLNLYSKGTRYKLNPRDNATPIYISKKKWSQDWNYWINQGLLDFIVTMNYSPDLSSFTNNIQSIKNNHNLKQMQRDLQHNDNIFGYNEKYCIYFFLLKPYRFI